MLVTFSFLAMTHIPMAMNPMDSIIDQSISARGKPTIAGDWARRDHGFFILETIPVSYVRTLHEPNQFRDEWHWEYMGQKFSQIIVMNGQKGWIKAGATNSREMPEWSIKAFAEANYKAEVCQFASLKNSAKFQLKSLPDAAVDDDLCHVINVQSKDQNDIVLYISKKSALLRRVISMQTREDGKAHKSEETFSNFKIFMGCTMATTIKRATESLPIQEDKIEKIEFIDILDSKGSFDKP